MFEVWLIVMTLLGLAVWSIRFVSEYDRLVVFRLGRIVAVRGPGLQFVMPFIEWYRRVDLRIVTMVVPMQDVITRDNVTTRTAAVCWFQIIDPFKATAKVEDHVLATSQTAQTTLRSVLGQHDLDDLLAERDKINARLQALIDRQTDGWGIKVIAVEVKDVELPEGMQRAMAKQAEAERLRRAKVVAADGELQAAEKLSAAAKILSAQPGALQLRQLQTMADVAAEKNSTLIFPIPVELLSGIAKKDQTHPNTTSWWANEAA